MIFSQMPALSPRIGQFVTLSKFTVASLALFSFSASAADTKAKPAEPAPKLYEAKTDTLRLDVNWKGILTPSVKQEIKLTPEAWAIWVLEEAAEHGTSVKAGDVVLKIREKDLTKAIEKMERDLEKAEIALQKAVIAAPGLEFKAKNELRAKEIAEQRAIQALKDYKAEDRAYNRDATTLKHKAAQLKLKYEQEEMAQLETMYRSDDLEEATESIVLQRHRDALEQYAFAAASATRGFKRYDRTEMRRDESESLKEETAKRAFAEGKKTAPLSAKERTLALEAQRRQLKELKEKLADYKTDKSQLTHTATADGIVYRGKFSHGKYLPTSAKILAPEAKLPPKSPILTIVNEGNLLVQGMVPEAQVGHLKLGMKVAVEAPAVPAATTVGTITKISDVPVAPGMFSVELSLNGNTPKAFAAGMAASVSAIPVYKTDELLIPQKLVHRDPLNPTMFFVWKKTGKSTAKQVVKLGLKSGDKVQVLDGITVGDKISATAKGDK